MRITRVEAIELRLPESEVLDKASAGQNSLIVKIHTDEGIVGVGEVDSCPRVAKAAIEAPFSHAVATGLGHLLIGRKWANARQACAWTILCGLLLRTASRNISYSLQKP